MAAIILATEGRNVQRLRIMFIACAVSIGSWTVVTPRLANAQADCAVFEDHIAAATTASAGAEQEWRSSNITAAKDRYTTAATELAAARQLNARNACTQTAAARVNFFLVEARIRWLGLTALAPGPKELSKADGDLTRGLGSVQRDAGSVPDVYVKATYYVREVAALDQLVRSNGDLETLMCSHEAVAVKLITPSVPVAALVANAQGMAQIKVTLDSSGTLLNASVYRSTQNKDLDAAALEAVQQSQFAPPVRECKPEGGSFLVTTTFRSQR